MCGIAGFQGEFDELLLARMGQMLAHRGPDDHGTWFDIEHRVGFAHRRLSIIDLSPRGHQPMWDATRSVVTVYNGELPYEQEAVDWPEFDAVVQVRKHLQRAVDRQLVSDVPVGAFLSGGLDSSSVVALAQRRLGRARMQCFTIGFKDPEARTESMAADLPYAQQVASHLGTDLHTIWVGAEMVDDLPRMIFH